MTQHQDTRATRRRPWMSGLVVGAALLVATPLSARASEPCDVAHTLHTGWSAIGDGMRAPGAAQGLPDARDAALTSLTTAMRPHVEAFGEAVGRIHNQRLWNYGTRLEGHLAAVETALGKDDVDDALTAVDQLRAELDDFLAGECEARPAAQKLPETQVPDERTLQAVQIASGIYDGDLAAIEPWLGVWPVPVGFEHSLGEGDESHRHATRLDNEKAVQAWLDRMAPLFQCGSNPGPRATDECEWEGGLVIAPVTTCDPATDCCRFSHDPDGQLQLSHNHVYIQQICFEVDATSGEAQVKRLDFLDGD